MECVGEFDLRSCDPSPWCAVWKEESCLTGYRRRDTLLSEVRWSREEEEGRGGEEGGRNNTVMCYIIIHMSHGDTKWEPLEK